MELCIILRIYYAGCSAGEAVRPGPYRVVVQLAGTLLPRCGVHLLSVPLECRAAHCCRADALPLCGDYFRPRCLQGQLGELKQLQKLGCWQPELSAAI